MLAVGEGDIEPVTLSDGSTVIPLKHTSKDSAGSEHVCQINGTTNFEDLVQALYILQVNHNTFDDRGMLAPTNDSIDQINEYVLDMLPGDAQHKMSSDWLVTDDAENMAEVASVEYLNKVNVPGTPPHDLQLKIGDLVMFMRNINFDSGLVNG